MKATFVDVKARMRTIVCAYQEDGRGIPPLVFPITVSRSSLATFKFRMENYILVFSFTQWLCGTAKYSG